MPSKRLAAGLAIIVSAFLLLAAAALYVLRNSVLAPFLIARVQDAARSSWGIEFEIGAVGGSWFYDLELRDLRLQAGGNEGPAVAASAERLRLRYRPLALLSPKGASAFLAAAEIEIEGLNTAVTLRPAPASAAEDPAPKNFFLPPALPALRFHGAAFRLDHPGLEVSGGEISVTAEGSGKEPGGIRLAVPVLEIRRPAAAAGETPEPLRGRLEVSGLLRLPPGRPGEAALAIDLALEAFEPAGRPVALQARAACDRQALRVDSLSARGWASRLELRGVRVPAQPLLSGETDALLRQLAVEGEFFSAEPAELFSLFGVPQGLRSFLSAPAVLRLEGLLREGRLEIPQGEILSPGGKITIRDLRTDLTRFPDPETPLEARLEIDWRDPVALDLPPGPPLAVAGGLRGRIEAEGTLRAPSGRIALGGAGLSLGGRSLDEFLLDAEAEGGLVRIARLFLRRGENRLTARGSLRPGSALIEQGSVEFDLADLRLLQDLYPSLPFPEVQGVLRGRASLSGPWVDPDGDLEAEIFALRLSGRAFGEGKTAVEKRGPRFALRRFDLFRSPDRLHLRGELDLARRTLSGARLEVSAAEIAPYLEACPAASGTAAGQARMIVSAAGPLARPQIEGELRLEKLRVAAREWRDLHARGASRGERGEMEIVGIRTPLGQLRAFARWDIPRRQAAGERLELAGEEFHLALVRPALLRWEPDGRLRLEGFEAEGTPGRLRLEGRWTPPGSFEARLRIAEGRLGKGTSLFPQLPLGLAGIESEIHAAGRRESPRLQIRGAVREVALGAEALAGRAFFEGDWGEGRLSIGDLRLEFPGWGALEVAGVVPLDPVRGAAAEDAHLRGFLHVEDLSRLPPPADLPRPTAGRLTARWEAAGSPGRLRGGIEIEGAELRFAEERGFPSIRRLQASVRLADDRLELLKAELAGEAGARLSARGAWTGIPDIASLLGSPPEEEAGDLALEIRLEAADLAGLLPPLAGIRRVGGRLEADLALSGPARRPNLEGLLTVADGGLRWETDAPPLQDLHLRARLAEDRLEIVEGRGRLGGGPFVLSGRVTGLASRAPDFALRLQGQNLLVFRSDTLGLRTDADLRLEGPTAGLSLSGELKLTDGFYKRNVSLLGGLASRAPPRRGAGGREIALFSLPGEALRSAALDVRIGAEEPFRVQNNLLRGAFRPDLRLVGTGEFPLLTGLLLLEPTTLTLPAGRMRFDQGWIRFRPEDPNRPFLDTAGEARLLGYDIRAEVRGAADEPSILLSSSPPLSEEALVMLLLTGRIPAFASGDSETASTGHLNTALYLGRDLLAGWNAGQGESPLSLIEERFEIQIGRAVTRGGERTLEARFRLADPWLRENLSLYLTGEKDVFDQYNAGVRLVFRFR